MNYTENLKGVVKALGKEKVELKDLEKATGKKVNSLRATVSVPNYKDLFKVEKSVVDDKVKSLYSLTEKGLKALETFTSEVVAIVETKTTTEESKK